MDWTSWLEPVRRTAVELRADIIGYMPTLLAAIGLLVVGWLVGRVLSAIVVRTAALVERHLPSRLRPSMVTTAVGARAGEIVGAFVFWIVFILFFGAATDLLGLPVLATWLAGLTRFLPHLLLGALIVMAGVMAGALAREAVAATTRASGLGVGDVIGRWVQLAIVAAAVVTAVDQVGIDSAFVTAAFTVILAAFLGASALAFGLGARAMVSNMIGVRQLRQHCEVGQLITIGDVRGRIREITGTTVLLDTPEGRHIVPGSLFGEKAATLITKSDREG